MEQEKRNMSRTTQKVTPYKPKTEASQKQGNFQIDSHAQLSSALNSLTVALKTLESKIKEAETTSNKIGQILVAKKIIEPADLEEAMRRKNKEPHKYLGQILCEMGFPQSIIMKNIYFSNKRKKLGEILVELNMITPRQLEDVLELQQNQKSYGRHQYLGDLLARKRIINEDEYMRALSAHFSMPIVSLKGFRVYPTMQKAIGEQYALKNRLVVLSNSPQKVGVAMAEPYLSIFEHLEKAMPKGKYILFCIARASEIETCLDVAYDPFNHIPY
jgi:hypothetical protein